jgi:hypothetical protein
VSILPRLPFPLRHKRIHPHLICYAAPVTTDPSRRVGESVPLAGVHLCQWAIRRHREIGDVDADSALCHRKLTPRTTMANAT